MAGFSAFCVGMFLLGVVRGNGWEDWYLTWNLLLAWLPLLFAGLLVSQLRHKDWSSWSAIGLSLAWGLFLPNSFYIVSDLIHLQDMQRDNVLFDALTFLLFALNGLCLGYVSLYMVQRQMLKRGVARMWLAAFPAVVLFLCSFAIYLGRDLRWNSWDVLVNPAGIVFDVSERILDPFNHPDTFTTTMIFFLFLFGLYTVATRLTTLIRKQG